MSRFWSVPEVGLVRIARRYGVGDCGGNFRPGSPLGSITRLCISTSRLCIYVSERGLSTPHRLADPNGEPRFLVPAALRSRDALPRLLAAITSRTSSSPHYPPPPRPLRGAALSPLTPFMTISPEY